MHKVKAAIASGWVSSAELTNHSEVTDQWQRSYWPMTAKLLTNHSEVTDQWQRSYWPITAKLL